MLLRVVKSSIVESMRIMFFGGALAPLRDVKELSFGEVLGRVSWNKVAESLSKHG